MKLRSNLTKVWQIALMSVVSAIFLVAVPDQAVGIKLNGPVISGGNVSAFAISPDGNWVVYLADQESVGRFELYRVSIAGGVTIKLREGGVRWQRQGVPHQSRQRVGRVSGRSRYGGRIWSCTVYRWPAGARPSSTARSSRAATSSQAFRSARTAPWSCIEPIRRSTM